MASIKLTVIGIEKMVTPFKRKDIYDKEVPGLVLRVHPTGTKSWSFSYKINSLSINNMIFKKLNPQKESRIQTLVNC